MNALHSQLNIQPFYMLMNGQIMVGTKEKVSYEVTEGMDVATGPGKMMNT